MGREVRRVPPGWEHPRDSNGDYIALEDGCALRDAISEWDLGKAAWDRGDHEHYDAGLTYEEWAGERPNPADFMPVWTPEEATHWQMYQNTSEGTPISPVFATPEACARWCADNKASAFAGEPAPYEWWLKVIRGEAGIGFEMNMNTGAMKII